MFEICSANTFKTDPENTFKKDPENIHFISSVPSAHRSAYAFSQSEQSNKQCRP